MARTVLIVDSDTGILIDADGRGREMARFRKIAGRMLSIGKDPVVLDYGANGGTRLEISCGGGNGTEILLKADTVKVSNSLTVNGRTLDDIVASGSTGGSSSGSSGTNGIIGTDNEIAVATVQDPAHPDDATQRVTKVSLATSVNTLLARAASVVSAAEGGEYVLKSDLAGVVDGISVPDDATLDDVKGFLNTLLGRIRDLVAVEEETA